MKKNCLDCGNEIEVADDPILSRLMKFCSGCIGERNAKAQAAIEAAGRAEKTAAWEKLCPPGYRETEVEELPNPAKADEVLAWRYGPTGLILHGETRKGKSRCAWLLMKREFDLGRRVRVLDALAGFQYASAFSRGGAEPWIMEHSRCGLLFFDDAFKAKLTESFEQAIFAIIEYRQSHKLPVLMTLNDTGETLAGRMTADRGGAFVARLKEMCQVITF